MNFDGVIWHDSNHFEVIPLRLSTELTYNSRLINADLVNLNRTQMFSAETRQVSEYATYRALAREAASMTDFSPLFTHALSTASGIYQYAQCSFG